MNLRGAYKLITLYITRHGETEWNKEGRLQGWKNSNLTEHGRNNAQLLGERLKNVDFEAIFSSPSGRTQETTDLIRGDREIPVIYDDNLKEIHMGDWEGKVREDIIEKYPNEFYAFWHDPVNYTPIGGETFEELRSRAEKVLQRIKEEIPSGNILIVTHAIMIKTLFTIFKGQSVKNLWDPPFIHDTSLTVVEMSDDGFKIFIEGNVSHKEDSTLIKKSKIN